MPGGIFSPDGIFLPGGIFHLFCELLQIPRKVQREVMNKMKIRYIWIREHKYLEQNMIFTDMYTDMYFHFGDHLRKTTNLNFLAQPNGGRGGVRMKQ